MKTRRIGIFLLALVAAGLWFGRLAWRAEHNLVSLHTHNMPLADVVRSLERQTWKNIRFDKSISAKITLNIDNAPLARALDLVADRAGARWQKTFAVGASDSAIKKLESALDGSEEFAVAGWTNIAPQFEEPDFPGGAQPMKVQPGGFIRRLIRPGEDGGIAGGGRGPGGIKTSGGFRSGRVAGAGGSNDGATMITMLPDGTIDQWASERIVLEDNLLPLLNGNFPTNATPETAKRVASIVHGKSRLFYALEKAPFGMEGPPGPLGAGRRAPPDVGAGMAQWRQQQRLRELSRSPEEQVARARQNTANQTQIRTSDETN